MLMRRVARFVVLLAAVAMLAVGCSDSSAPTASKEKPQGIDNTSRAKSGKALPAADLDTP
jgi:hypothetical protein